MAESSASPRTRRPSTRFRCARPTRAASQPTSAGGASPAPTSTTSWRSTRATSPRSRRQSRVSSTASARSWASARRPICGSPSSPEDAPPHGRLGQLPGPGRLVAVSR
eukprot:3047464-Heterocapsa_arctica.AAC.1